LNVVAGAGMAVVDSRTTLSFNGNEFNRLDDDIDAYETYLLASRQVHPTLDLVARLGYARVDINPGVNFEHGGVDPTDMAGLTPGLGAIWRPVRAVTLRAAAGRTIKRPFVANQTLQPTQLAGFNEQFDDLDGTRADWLGLGADLRVNDAIRVGTEVTLRRLTREISVRNQDGNVTHTHRSQSDDRGVAYLYWTPSDRFAVSLEVIGGHFSARNRADPEIKRVQSLSTPLQLTYSLPSGWFATALASYVAQEVDVRDAAGGKSDLDDHGVLIDLTAGYRLPKRLGIVALEIANLLDQHLSFQDESFRTAGDDVNPRFIPSRTFLATLTLNF
jgi:hypothetical protein